MRSPCKDILNCKKHVSCLCGAVNEIPSPKKSDCIRRCLGKWPCRANLLSYQSNVIGRTLLLEWDQSSCNLKAPLREIESHSLGSSFMNSCVFCNDFWLCSLPCCSLMPLCKFVPILLSVKNLILNMLCKITKYTLKFLSIRRPRQDTDIGHKWLEVVSAQRFCLRCRDTSIWQPSSSQWLPCGTDGTTSRVGIASHLKIFRF